jgi:hypothetical protein
MAANVCPWAIQCVWSYGSYRNAKQKSSCQHKKGPPMYTQAIRFNAVFKIRRMICLLKSICRRRGSAQSFAKHRLSSYIVIVSVPWYKRESYLNWQQSTRLSGGTAGQLPWALECHWNNQICRASTLRFLHENGFFPKIIPNLVHQPFS